MIDGVWTNVFDVVVPSCQRQNDFKNGTRGDRYIFNLLDGKISVCWYADFLRLHIYDDQKRVRSVPFEELVDLQVGCSQLRSRVIPSYKLFSSVDLFEHVVHRLDIVVVQKPY